MSACRILLIAGLVVFLAGCGGAKTSPPNALPTAPAATSPSADDPMFLGLPQDQTRKHPQDSALRDFVMVTKVELSTYEDYLAAKRDGHIFEELKSGRWQYWATEHMIDVPFPDGKRAYAKTLARFKSSLPAATTGATTRSR